jgi:hypothetical protein
MMVGGEMRRELVAPDRLSRRKLGHEIAGVLEGVISPRLPDAATCAKSSVWRGGDPLFVFWRLASSGRR